MPPPLATVITEPNGDLIRQILVALLTGFYPDGTVFTLPGSGGGTTDVTDRSGRLLGHVTVDNSVGSMKLLDAAGTNLATISAAGAVKVDGSAVTQPVSGTFWQATQPVSLATNTPDVTDRAARLLGHVTVDNASIAVTGTFWQATQPVSGTVTANAGTGTFTISGTVTANIGTTNGLALDATLTGGSQKAIARGGAKGTTTAADITSTAVDANTQALHVNLVGTQATVPVTGTFWQATQPVSIAATVATKEARSSTATQTSVASSATSVTLLASNANRLGATIYNDSSQVLYVLLGATASATAYTNQMVPNAYYEVPYNYTGAIAGIWASVNGNARVTELT